MADLLDRILQEIRDRKEAARAAYEESERLQRALAALETDQSPRGDSRARRRGGGGGATGRRRSRAAPGTNRAATLGLVDERPGVTAGELAAASSIAHATVSTTVACLVRGGVVERIELPGGGVGFRLGETDASADVR
jgi:hypothetical protein